MERCPRGRPVVAGASVGYGSGGGRGGGDGGSARTDKTFVCKGATAHRLRQNVAIEGGREKKGSSKKRTRDKIGIHCVCINVSVTYISSLGVSEHAAFGSTRLSGLRAVAAETKYRAYS